MSEGVRKRAVHLWLIAAVCALPVLASYVAYYFMQPTGHTNYGDLLETRPLPNVQLQLADGRPFALERLKGKWLLLMVDSGGCDEGCRRKLFDMRQLRLSQGKNVERIERVWLIDDDKIPAAAAVADYGGTWLVRAAGSELLRYLPAQQRLSDHLYIVDPLGNLVLRYPRDPEPGRIIKDLERLLKASRIG